MSGAVITGLGVIAPNGMGTAAYWEAVKDSRAAIGPLTRFDAASYPARLAGEVRDFDPAAHLPSRLIPQTDHSTRLSLVAADEALRDAGIETGTFPEFGVGVVTGSSAGGFSFGHQELDNLWRKGPDYVSAYQSFAWFYAVNTGQISIRNDLRGPSGVMVSDQAGGLDAIAQARRYLRRGLPAAVTGAIDGSLCPWGWIAHTSTGELSGADDPALGYRPFDADADGHVPGEGGALLILEDETGARDRGAPRIYGHVLGYASTFDARPGTVGVTEGAGLRRAAELALEEAGAKPGDIDVVFADAWGTPTQDQAEAAALRAVFGANAVPVAATKTMTGRLGAGTGPLDVATALLAMADGVIPPAVHSHPSADYGIDLVVGSPRQLRPRTALVLARGAKGFNSALVVGAPS